MTGDVHARQTKDNLETHPRFGLLTGGQSQVVWLIHTESLYSIGRLQGQVSVEVLPQSVG